MKDRIRAAVWVTVASLAGCATDPHNPSFPISPNQAQKAVEQMRDDPLPLQRPLVVIGGILDPKISSPLLAYFFGQVTSNAKIIPVSVSFCGNFDECRQRIIDAVDEQCPSSDPQWTSEVDVVGISLGGLAARYAAAPSQDPARPRRLKIAHLYSISSPHSGAKLANALAFNDYLRSMQTDSPFLKSLAGDDPQANYELIPYVLLNDEIVGDKNAAPPGKGVYWLSNTSIFSPHIAAMLDNRILADISRRLRGETPLTLSPPAPLPP